VKDKQATEEKINKYKVLLEEIKTGAL